jgi:hypothetical protein
MIDGQLIARKTSDDPIIYRVILDGVEIGSISLQTRHVHPIKTYRPRPGPLAIATQALL